MICVTVSCKRLHATNTPADIEDQLELDGEFKRKIERAKKEIADGVRSRVRQPQPGK
jgi:hypothetical protein